MDFWLPVSDVKTEGVWKDYNGDTIENYTLPWLGGVPDGGLEQNCARVAGENVWTDMRCDWPNYACICSYRPNFYLKIRGLCPSSAIDEYYKLMNDWADFRKLQIQGLKRSSITYDEDKKIWSLNVAQSNISATSKASQASFTLGKHNWTIRGDDGCNAHGTEYDSFSDVGEIRVYWRADFQSGSRVLKKVF